MNRELLFYITAILLCAGILSCNKKEAIATCNYEVVPLPKSITPAKEAPFILSTSTHIGYPKGNEKLRQTAVFLSGYIREMTGIETEVTVDTGSSNSIHLVLDRTAASSSEGYRLKVGKRDITITGSSEAGVFYGIQTLRKSLPVTGQKEISFPAVQILDEPEYRYRGMHLDVGRHFFSTDFIKKYIDIIALHNLNTFHWHLTDDQGWRIEIKKYPKLTEIGSKRKESLQNDGPGKFDGKPYGGFYTQEEVKDIIEYAAERYITVIPEIDLPGHITSALAAYPDLGCTGGPYEVATTYGVHKEVLCVGNEQSFRFAKDVLSEIIELFPSHYIHVGGDECPRDRWQQCPKCQALIHNNGWKDTKEHKAEDKLQSYFMTEVERFVNSKGRQIIGWDEILEGGLAPNATVMSWRGVAGGIEAAKQKHDVIMTPNTYLYFDYYQTKDIANEPEAIGGYVPVETVYNYEPMPADLTPEEQKYIIGVQANLWTEYIPTYSQVEYMELPRMAALSEIQWTMPEKKNYEGFLKRLPQLVDIYDVYKYNYAKHVFDVNAVFTPNPKDGTLDVTLSTIDNSPIYYTLDGTEPSAASQLYTETLKLKQNCTFKAITVRPAGNSRVVTEEIAFNKASMKPVTMLQPVNKQYEFKGAPTLVDGLKGNGNYKTGRWIAFYKNDMEAVIDMQQPTEISSASISTCVEKGDWVFDARAFSVAVSEDGKNFKEIASEKYPAMKQDDKNGVFNHTLTFDPVTARYVKVTALAEHSIPAWHGGKGNPAFLFVDEISLN